MSTLTIACNRRDAYYPEEEGLLQQLKRSHPNTSWRKLVIHFNASVPHHRQRTEYGLENKWKHMRITEKDEKLLRELKLAHPQADWSDIACLFNRTVPVHRNRTAETLRLKWENIQRHGQDADVLSWPPSGLAHVARCTSSPSVVSSHSGGSGRSSPQLPVGPIVTMIIYRVESGEDHRAALENARTLADRLHDIQLCYNIERKKTKLLEEQDP
ncbi:hypothetical protein ACJ73_00697 [Blastomyces percursus]|uniref:Myb-like domain-containing protein n=1 Tax=Blastomyces percursus TaxID=1658174 RepID=A0A1J9QHE0_9EURO|nr:hypothetical protein ACJ73_00697 [Blastomyces percursus]